MIAMFKHFGSLTLILMFLPLSSFGQELPAPKKLEFEKIKFLSLRQAAILTLSKNPELASFSKEIKARDARILQESLFPNPKLRINAEDIIGTKELKDFDKAEATVQLRQTILLGGKISARKKAASLFYDLAYWDYQSKRMDVLTQLSKSFIDVLGGQERLALLQNLLNIAEKTHQVVLKKIKAGKIARIEEPQVKIAKISMQLELNKAKQTYEALIQRLISFWGGNGNIPQKVVGDLKSIYPVPHLKSLEKDLANNPDLARWSTAIEGSQAVLDKEKTKSIPDITLNAGYRRNEDLNANAMVFGFTIPLQFFNRNQGAIEEARQRLGRTEAEQRSVQYKIKADLAKRQAVLKNAYLEVFTLKTQILEEAKKGFDSVEKGYRRGKFGYLDVLQSQRTYFNAKLQYLESLIQYHKSKADLDRLLGKPLSQLLGTKYE